MRAGRKVKIRASSGCGGARTEAPLAQGMQRNPGCSTIEGVVHAALVASGGIIPENASDFSKAGGSPVLPVYAASELSQTASPCVVTAMHFSRPQMQFYAENLGASCP